MTVFLILLHIIVCAALIVVVLIQSGRGGGLVEAFSGIESMFGTKTNVFLTRVTNILAVLFFLTCLSLAFMSLRQSRSLMSGIDSKAAQDQAAKPEPATSLNTTPPTQEKPGEPVGQIPAAPKTE